MPRCANVFALRFAAMGNVRETRSRRHRNTLNNKDLQALAIQYFDLSLQPDLKTSDLYHVSAIHY